MTNTEVTSKKIIEKIIEIRKKKGYSIEYVAQELNLSPSAYHKIEQKKTKLSIDRFIQILNVFEQNFIIEVDNSDENKSTQKISKNDISDFELEELNLLNKKITEQYIYSLKEEIKYLRFLILEKT
jgi:transcriptional regulator with XRE-family HTH domain